MRHEVPMNVQIPGYMDKAAFLAWVQGREERYELENGRVVMMVGASLNHGRIVGNVYFALRRQLDPQWEVIAEFGLDSSPRTLRYPDILVHRAGGDGSRLATSEPALLAEVLSPSSETLDLGDKAAEYLHLPSLQAYLVLAQNEAKAWVWQREPTAFQPGPTVISGVEQSVAIKALAVDIPFSEIYRNVSRQDQL
jgi:Uma2 family endonuclease